MSNNMYGSYENNYEDLMAPDGNFEEEWESVGDFEDEIAAFEDEIGNPEDEASLFEEEFPTFEDQMDPFDMEGPDPFLGDIVNAIPGPVRGALKGLARQGAGWVGNAIAGQRGGRIAQGVADAVLNNIDDEVGEMEEEADPLGDFEAVGGDAHILHEMSHLATLAAESESEEEADHFLGAIAGLAGKLLPGLLGGLTGGSGEEEYEFEEEGDQFFPALIPLIGPAVSALGSLFKRQGETQMLMETLPVIAAKSATDIAKKVDSGKPVKPTTVAAVVAKQTAKTLASKPAVTKAVQANREMAHRRPAPARRPTYNRPSAPRQNFRRPTYSRPTYARPSNRRPNYARPNIRRPAYSRPNYRRPNYARPNYRRPTYGRPNYRPYNYRRPNYWQNYQPGSSWRPNYQPSTDWQPNYQPTSYGGYQDTSSYIGYGRRGRVIRPRYCVY